MLISKGVTNAVSKYKENKEKGRSYPLAVLKDSIIMFPPKAPQKTRKHHLPYYSTLSTTTHPTASKQINYLIRHNPRQPKATEKKAFHKAQTT